MTVQIQRPGTLDVTVNNPNDILYIKGDETTNGSIRFQFTGTEKNAHLERRAGGVWNDTGIRIASSSLDLGLDMTMSAIAGFLETVNPSAAVGHQRAIIPHIQFDDATGTTLNQLHIPIANIADTFILFSGAIGQQSGTVIGQIITDTPGRIISTSIHEVGTVPATAEVAVKIFIGTDNTGTLVNQRNIAASEFTAGATLTIDYDEDFGLDAGVSYFMEFSSVATFSLKTDVSNNILITHTGHALAELTAVSENLVYDENFDHILTEALNPVYLEQF